MSGGGNINITISDGGSASIVVPGASVQLVIGCSSTGTVNQLVVTRNPATLSSFFGVGPLPEAAALACLAGGTVIACRVPSNTAGAVLAKAGSTVSTTSGNGVSPIAVTTTANHGLMTGDVVQIASVVGNTNANTTAIITVTGATTFTMNGTTGNGAYVSGGTVTPKGIVTTIASGSLGTSVPTPTGTPVDTYYIQALFTVSTGPGTTGTVGTASPAIFYQLSVDAGRNFGPVQALGTATTIAVGSTGVTINLTNSATIAHGQVVTLSTTEPLWNTAGVQAALTAFQSSQYAIAGVGSVHLVGSQGVAASGANCATIQGYLETLASSYVYTRSFMAARDASPPAQYGGTGESDSTWSSSILTDYSATSARRIGVSAAYWNMPSAFPVPASTGAPALRRPLAYAAAARQVTIPPQRHDGRVKDGSIQQIVVNPLTDPSDGFVYHDERMNPGLDYLIAGTGGRFMSTMTRVGLPGVFITNPLSMAPVGSDFFLLPLGMVMDVFASIIHTVGQQSIDDDVRINPTGTIYESDARAIESVLAGAVNATMFSQAMISQPVIGGPGGATTGSMIVIDRTNNVKQTSNVNLTGQIISRGYVLTITATLSYQNPSAAA